MRAVFFDKERATYTAVENVVQLNGVTDKYNGKYTNLWRMYLDNGNTIDLPQKWYSVHRIDV